MARIKEFKIFSTPTCGYCHMLKDWLTEKKIPFTDINVAMDPAKGVEMIQKTGQMGVPVSVILFEDGKEDIILGFDQERIAKILGLEK
jgi:glutaredoxin 3